MRTDESTSEVFVLLLCCWFAVEAIPATEGYLERFKAGRLDEIKVLMRRHLEYSEDMSERGP
jgi:hypothetical protein